MKFHPLEHRLLRELGNQIRSKYILIAVSGGADSIALLLALSRVQKILKLKLAVAHFHHGGESNFRDEALAFVLKESAKRGLPCYYKKASEGDLHREGQGEAGLRRLRQGFLKQLLQTQSAEVVAFAHHADDLVETQCLRLIRGTGREGLKAMNQMGRVVCRPFLTSTKDELLMYLQDLGQSFVEDPSNQESKYLRNFVRNEWLPLLEKRTPGALKSLCRSLNLLSRPLEAQVKEEFVGAGFWLSGVWSQKEFQSQPESQKENYIVRAYRLVSPGFYSQSHIYEVLKRLQSASRKKQIFIVGGLVWTLDADFIRFEKKDCANTNV